MSECQQSQSFRHMTSASTAEVSKLNSFLTAFSDRVFVIDTLRSELQQQHHNHESGVSSSIVSTDKTHISKFLYPIDEAILNILDERIRKDTLELADIHALQALKPSQMSALMQQTPSATGRCDALVFLPVIPLDAIADTSKLDALVAYYSECLIQDAINVESLVGYYIGRAADRTTACAIITSMLNSGLTYVLSHGSKLMGLYPCSRSMLILSASVSGASAVASENGAYSFINLLLPVVPPALTKRLKDMPRIFRNKIHKPLSLRLNTDLTVALSKLRLHHGADCWVGEDLEAVWRLMASTSPPMLMVFELWYGDDMIAADFAHPVCGGKSLYVATRFFDSDAAFKNLQPGFLLALAECAYLRRQGCHLWDLGGVNLCPLMRYKNDLTGKPYARPDALYVFRKVREMPIPPGMATMKSSGILDENVTVESLSIL